MLPLQGRLSRIRSRVRISALCCVTGISLLAAPRALSQDLCASWGPRLLDTSDNCVNEPFRNRAKDVKVFHWQGHDYMMFNGGNELFLYNIDEPARPIKVAESRFRFGTRGDSDYDLLRFDVSDDSRYLVLAHKVKRTVVVDLGTGPTPAFGTYAAYEALDTLLGGFVFNRGGTNYLLAGGLAGGCAAGTGLYVVNSPGNLTLLSCLDVGGSPITVRGLQIFDSPVGYYLYTGVNGGLVHVFQASGSGPGLSFVYRSSPPGMFGARYQLSVDKDNYQAASSDYYGGVIRIWDLTDPGFPTVDFTISATVDTISLRSPGPNAASTLFGIKDGTPRSTRTWEVSASGAHEFAAEFWSDPTLPHNIGPSCMYASSGGLSPDGSVLYLSRNATHDVFDLSECLEPTPARAGLTITPSPVFPGRPIEVRDTSTGRVDERRLWITRNSNTTPTVETEERTLSFTIPAGVPLSDSYTAHIEVDSSLEPADSYHEEPILIDRTPHATFTIAPAAIIVGDTVTLSAAADGVVPSGGYQWAITSPSGSTLTKSGPSVTHIIGQNEGGTWQFKLTVHYDHGAAGISDPGDGTRFGDLDGDAKYEFEVLQTLTVSSVAADFAVTPGSPLHTQTITLDAGLSKPDSPNLAYKWEVVSSSPAHSYNSCPREERCVIPPESLLPGATYSITLTVWNGDDSSSKTKWVPIGNGNIQPTITWTPTSPEIGERVTFSINGVPADLSSASWNMGGGGCDGADSTPDCSPSLWDACKAQAYRFNSSGPKTVSLSIVVGGNSFSAPPVTVTVQPSGSCSSSPPPPGVCQYTLGRSSVEMGPSGGTVSISVSTTAGCSWVANATQSWITVISPPGQVTGTGTVSFKVDPNDGPQREAYVVVGGKTVLVIQAAPWRAADFNMSKIFPEIGETVTFSVDPLLQVVSWDFGEEDCRGNSPDINCTFLPAGACNTVQWSFREPGPKAITMVLSDGRTQTKYPSVRPQGECCFADGKPDTAFSMSASEIYTGETVTFTDGSAKSVAGSAKALGISWSPTLPKIGETVVFGLDGITGTIERVTWNFGEIGCDGKPAVQDCVPNLWNSCTGMTFAFASSGLKSVSVDVFVAGTTQSIGPQSIEVANTGSCDGDVGSSCSYSLSSSSASFPFEGGDGSFDITTDAECSWNAATTAPFVALTNASGIGPGTVAYTVNPNPNPASRSGNIRVEGRVHSITQDGDRGNTAPTAWEWTITRVEDEMGQAVNEIVRTSFDPEFSFTFELAGSYRVLLTASNCYGSDYSIDHVRVLEMPVEDFVVGAAVKAAGANNTQWETDLRFFNPCGEPLDVTVTFEPEGSNNTEKALAVSSYPLRVNETRVFSNLEKLFPQFGDDEISGSLRVESQSASGCKVLTVSRTYNQTNGGTFGLFVPALPVKRPDQEHLDMAGLTRNADYRTNLRLVNYGDADVWVPIVAFDRLGNQISSPEYAKVFGHSAKQLNDVASWLGIEGDITSFAVRVGVAGLQVQAFATVVDNRTGDSALFMSSFTGAHRVWVAGLASTTGSNESSWRSDVWLFNPTEDWLLGEGQFVIDGATNIHEFGWESLAVHRTKVFPDVVSDTFGLSETKGYLVLTGLDGYPAPQVAARTYNLSLDGGTFGLGLHTFSEDKLLEEGETAFIVGVSMSEDQATGFRTNLALLNADTERWLRVRLTLIGVAGEVVGEPTELDVKPEVLRQFDLAERFGLGGETGSYSLMIEVVEGGNLAAYATEIDNVTNDAIFIPAQRLFTGLPR